MQRATFAPRANPTGLALTLALALGLSACGEQAGPTDAVLPPAAPGTSTVAVKPLHFAMDNPAIGTEIGVRKPGVGTSTSGRAGWLSFGPYAALPPGNYQAAVQGVVQPGHAGIVYFDIAAGKGARIIHAVELDPDALAAARAADGMVVLPFTLTDAVSDLEVRIRVTEQAQLAVSALDIRPVP